MVKLLERLALKKAARVKDKESGNSIVAYVMLFPVVFASFGLAVDTTVATYTQTSLQSNLDAATQSTLSQANNPGQNGNSNYYPGLRSNIAEQTFVNVYDMNRSGGKEQPFVICQGSVTSTDSIPAGASPRLIRPATGCSFTLNQFNYRVSGSEVSLYVNIVEKSKPVFLRYVGVDEFKYNLISESRITYERG